MTSQVRCTDLDRKLSDTLRPLAEIGATMRVAQHPNNLCLGYHYCLAHNSTVIPDGRIDLIEWNDTESLHRDLMKHLDGIFICHFTKKKAKKMKDVPSSEGFFNSLAVTSFRQRYLFLRNTPEAVSIAKTFDHRLSLELCNDLIQRGSGLNVFSDILDQADALLGSLIGTGTERYRIIKRSMPRPKDSVRSMVDIYIFSAPCTDYMLRRTDSYIPIEVDDVLLDASEFETHCMWHVPNKPNQDVIDQTIRESLGNYHSLFFKSAADRSISNEFTFVHEAYNELVGIEHPSYSAETFVSPNDFRQCLEDHHRTPPPPVDSDSVFSA